jgi:tetratricopeptide (TPR) repeat protein
MKPLKLALSGLLKLNLEINLMYLIQTKRKVQKKLKAQKMKLILFLVASFIAIPSVANMSVQLTSPDWAFLLKNEPWAESETQFFPGERGFAREVQKLFSQGNKTALIEKLKSRKMKGDSAALLLLRGQVFLKLKDYPQAEQALVIALNEAPNFALAHRSLSIVYLFDKQYEKARQHLTNTLEFGVTDAQVYGQLAYVHLQLNQAASAVAGYQYALFLEPSNRQWKQGLLYALIETQALDQAQALVDEMLQVSPENSQLWLQRGQISLQKGRVEQAIASVEAALLLGVNDANNIAFAAQLHIKNGSPRRAVELLGDNSDKLIAGGKIDELDQIAQWLAFENDWQKLAQLMKAVDVKSSKVSARYRSRFSVYQAKMLLANRSNQKSSNVSARKYLTVAIESDPSNGEALLTLAHVLQNMNHNEQATIYYTRAQSLPTYKERALLGRSQLAIDGQQYQEALRLLRQVIHHNPMRTDVLANIDALENLVRSQS